MYTFFSISTGDLLVLFAVTDLAGVVTVEYLERGPTGVGWGGVGAGGVV